MTLQVLIVDDEALARARLRTLLGDCRQPEAVAAGEAASAVRKPPCRSCSSRRRSRTLASAMPWPAWPCPAGTVLVTLISATCPRSCVEMRTCAPLALGSTPCLTAFSTSGCRISGGRRTAFTRSSSDHSTRRRGPKRTCSISR